MALSPQQLSQILNNSKKIIDNDKLVESKTSSIRSKVSMDDIDPNSYSDEWDNYSLSSGPSNEQYATESTKQPLTYTNESVINSNFPDKIKKSFIENRISSGVMPTDDLDNITQMALQQRQTAPKQRPMQQINETVSYAQQPTSAGIDYNYLKYIISESIKEYFQNNPIEVGGNLKQITLYNGTIKLIDSKGNIFSAQLEHKGNVADKKKEK